MDTEAGLSTLAVDAVSYDPMGTEALEGHKEFKQFFQELLEAFESVGLTEDFVSVIGNEAAVKWTGNGVGKNGRAITFEGIDIIKVNEAGRIQMLSAYWNMAALAAQISD